MTTAPDMPTKFIGAPCVPEKLPLGNIDWGSLVASLGRANRAVSRYDGVLRSIPNEQVLLSPLTSNEAVLSSKIEGTQATLQEVLEFESGKKIDDEETKKDILEILNYRKALHASKELLGSRPLNLGILLKAHEILLEGVRGQNKFPGQFRKQQNWIGRDGTNVGQARFIPPSPLDLPAALTNFENYLHYEELDPLAQLAIVHAQFEILHPFADGNGRVGRILIPIFLFEKRVLSSPMFYLSSYLERHRQEYYDRLLNITKQGDWNGWIKFFLEAVSVQADENAKKAIAILDLRSRLKKEFPKISALALDALFQAPIFSRAHFVQVAELARSSAKRITDEFIAKGVLKEISGGGGRRSAVLYFSELLQIVEEGVFDEKNGDVVQNIDFWNKK